MDIAACAAAQDGPQKLPCSVSIVNVCDRLPVLPLLLWRVLDIQEFQAPVMLVKVPGRHLVATRARLSYPWPAP
eukprot:g1593.t1